MNKAFVFPGQGSQKIGMGKDFYDNITIAKETFQKIDDSLNQNLSKIIFEGTEDDLNSTYNTQPALMAMSMAIIASLKSELKLAIDNLCSYTAGHSLGEYSALCASESLELSDTANLLRIRAESMQNAAPKGSGAMAACIGISVDRLLKIIHDNIKDGLCQIANDNVEGQIVISGSINAVDYILGMLKDLGYKSIRLNVSAPFHSDLIKPAEKIMSNALDNVIINTPKVPIIANVTADITNKSYEIKHNLVKQICGRVRWRETMNRFKEIGITEIVEIGSGKVLAGLAKKSGHDFVIKNISNIYEFEEYCKNV